ncbi:MAG: hypothetical protein HPY73_01950 [Methanomassiliicoccales archaeon]|nr:MAG: hypothetical protein HPY73_01950 [Methanomassiliicoccales archaeon]
MDNGENREQRIRVCPYCLSHDIEERVLIGGPMAQLDNDDGTFICHKCRRVAVPLEFSNWEEYMAFTWEKDVIPSKKFRTLPMMPVIWDDISGDALVTSISWTDRLVQGPDVAPFKDYWNAAMKEAYQAKEAFIIDVTGTVTGNPRVNELQRLMKRKAEISLDVGIRSEHDVYDCFTLGAWEVIACSWAMPSIKIFEQVVEMTDRCIPCLCHSKKIVWGKEKDNPLKIEEAVRQLKDYGYRKVAIMDLWSLGKKKYSGEDIVLRALGQGVDVMAGGGITDEALDKIREIGAVGAILDPFSPTVMSHLVKRVG